MENFMRLFITIFSLFVLVVGCFCVSSAQAIDLSNGLMYAVPAPNGPPAFDGTDKGWDLSAAEPAWMSAQMAKELHAKLAVNYDADNLYIYVKATLPGRKLTSPGGPADILLGRRWATNASLFGSDRSSSAQHAEFDAAALAADLPTLFLEKHPGW